VDGQARDPFGETPAPWSRSLLRLGKGHAPKRYATAAGALGPAAALFITSGDGLDRPTRVALVAGLTFIPPLLVEAIWRRRKRRQEERLIVLPD